MNKVVKDLFHKLQNHHQVICRKTLSSSRIKVTSPLDFKPKKALIVTKVSRYEFERSKMSHLTESEFESALTNRGSDYTMIK